MFAGSSHRETCWVWGPLHRWQAPEDLWNPDSIDGQQTPAECVGGSDSLSLWLASHVFYVYLYMFKIPWMILHRIKTHK